MTAKKRIIHLANILYLVFLLIQFIPNSLDGETYSLYTIVFASAIEVLVIVVSIFIKKEKGFHLFTDIVSFISCGPC